MKYVARWPQLRPANLVRRRRAQLARQLTDRPADCVENGGGPHPVQVETGGRVLRFIECTMLDRLLAGLIGPEVALPRKNGVPAALEPAPPALEGQ